ncbi:MAG: hypothetical protein JO352_12710 [Chloroflexi bacterium]|nr:hypothetical protein [Chloroflexota bacterium]MBV9597078.1 hypothetical protein [Chloroflexota bacterium]
MPGQMYDPAIQRAVLEKLAHWRQLPEGDLIGMLSPVERLRFRPEALEDLEWDGLIVAHTTGDERMVSITEAGDAWLRRHQGNAIAGGAVTGGVAGVPGDVGASPASGGASGGGGGAAGGPESGAR